MCTLLLKVQGLASSLDCGLWMLKPASDISDTRPPSRLLLTMHNKIEQTRSNQHGPCCGDYLLLVMRVGEGQL